MSPRAAWRLERLGYGPVYDYAWGKVDWLAAGLPTEGTGTRERPAVDALEEALTCAPTTAAGEAARQAREAGAPNVLVVNDEGILLGRFRLDADRPSEQTVEAVMEPGPVTVRANEPLDPLLQRMASRASPRWSCPPPKGAFWAWCDAEDVNGLQIATTSAQRDVPIRRLGGRDFPATDV